MFVAFAVVGVEPDPRAGRKLVLAHEIFLRRRTKNASMADQLTSALASNRAWTADGGHEATKKLLDSSFGKFSAISQRTISSRSWPRKASKRFWLTSDPLKQKLFASHCANGTPARVNFWGLEQLELSSTRRFIVSFGLFADCSRQPDRRLRPGRDPGNFCADAARLDTTLKREHEYNI
jgi:hypothetical protein